jgi:RNA polymerase primary sigma factor
MSNNIPQAMLNSKLSKMASSGKSVEDMTALYMREMSIGELLDRDGEIEIGKRIEENNRDIRFTLLKYPNNIEAVFDHYDDVVAKRKNSDLFVVDIYEPYDVAMAEAGSKASTVDTESASKPLVDFERVSKSILKAKELYKRFQSSVKEHGIGHENQGTVLESVASSLQDLEFHPGIVDEFIYNIDNIQSNNVVGGADGAAGMKDYERLMADIAINKCLMTRSDFLTSFVGRETDPSWVDEQIKKGGKTGFYFNLAQDEFKGYQKKLKSISERSMLSVYDIKENNRSLNQGIARLKESKSEMIEANLRLVVAYANKHSNYNNNFLDLVQEGNVGLMKAVDRFDYRKGYKFSTYATWWIKQGVNNFLSRNSYTSKLPGHIVDARRTINKAGDDFYKEHGREATLEEIISETGFTAEKIAEIKEAVQHSSSLDAPIADNEGAGLIDFVEDSHTLNPESMANSTSINKVLSDALDKLSPRENEIMSMRFGVNKERNYSSAEVAETFNITEQKVHEIETKALRKLRHPSLSIDLKEGFDAIQSSATP